MFLHKADWFSLNYCQASFTPLCKLRISRSMAYLNSAFSEGYTAYNKSFFLCYNIAFNGMILDLRRIRASVDHENRLQSQKIMNYSNGQYGLCVDNSYAPWPKERYSLGLSTYWQYPIQYMRTIAHSSPMFDHFSTRFSNFVLPHVFVNIDVRTLTCTTVEPDLQLEAPTYYVIKAVPRPCEDWAVFVVWTSCYIKLDRYW